MSYLQVTAVRPSLRVPDQFNTLGRSAIQCIAPVNMFNLHNALKPSFGSSKRCTELMKCNTLHKRSAYCYQQCTPVCSFGGKEDYKNDNEGGSPWKSIEKAMSSFKKEPSLEDVLRQQMERQEYYDGDPPGGGGDGGGDGGGGFGGTDDEGFDGLLDDILQVTLAILELIVLYLYIIRRDQLKLFIRSIFDFILGKKGPPIRTIMYAFAELGIQRVSVFPVAIQRVINLLKLSMADDEPTYPFEHKHNLYALLQVTPDNEEVAYMIRWLQRSNIRFALTECPVIYRNHLLDFWCSSTLQDDVNGRLLEATVARQENCITERLIRTNLQLHDDDHNPIHFTIDHLLKIFQ
ncbi:uncharacterized protein LOC143570008 [Bidens hawaiensis]|uniref:uncharacterized protein LOC143570008 n=1 Tax=Bidens hawaiensis TaxID=980011 RepID=UPI0040491A55